PPGSAWRNHAPCHPASWSTPTGPPRRASNSVRNTLTPPPLAVTRLWCHTGVMDLDRYVADLRTQLAASAEAGGEDARGLAERLSVALDAAARLALLEALSDAASEITRELA